MGSRRGRRAEDEKNKKGCKRQKEGLQKLAHGSAFKITLNFLNFSLNAKEFYKIVQIWNF